MDFGVEIDDLGQLPEALREHRLVVHRGESLDLARQVELTQKLGSVVGAEPGVPQVRYEDDRRMHPDQAYFNEQWHADASWCAEGPVVTVLFAVRASRGAAATELVDTVSALDRLPDGLRDEAAEWTALHHVERSRHQRHGRGSPLAVRGRRRYRSTPPRVPEARVPTPVAEPGAAHPVVVTASTGRAGVTLGDHAWTIDGLDATEGPTRVAELQAAIVATGDRHLHLWRTNDLVAFDNRTVLHRRDPAGRRVRSRVLRRTIAWPDD